MGPKSHSGFFSILIFFKIKTNLKFSFIRQKLDKIRVNVPEIIRKCKKASGYVQTYWAYAYIEVCLLHSGLMIFF